MLNFIPAMVTMMIAVLLCLALLVTHPEMPGVWLCLNGLVIGFGVGCLAVPVILRNYI